MAISERPTAAIEAFARSHGVDVMHAGEIDALPRSERVFGDDPRVDFGRLESLTPHAVLRPRDREQLAACVQFFAREGLRYKTRGAAHSSGGQVLIEDGVVLDLRHLRRIVDDDPRAETIAVEAGAWWLDIVRHLQPQGRRPWCVTANLRTSVGGTLAVGGFGDSSHLHGLQIAHVERLTLMTPDGSCHVLDAQHEWFPWVLAGRGQLGIVVEVTLRTMTRPWTVAARVLRWKNLDDFLRDASKIVAAGADNDFLRARLHWKPRNDLPQVSATLGTSSDTLRDPTAFAQLAPASASALSWLDLFASLTAEPPDSWREPCPALEIVLPLPHALAVWPRLARQIVDAGVPYLQPEGHSVMVVPCDSRFPLAPLPSVAGSTRCMMIALRPELPTAAEARAIVPALREIGRAALACGGRVYMMSIELDSPGYLAQQFGDALGTFVRLKRQLDPRGLLDPGWL